MKIEGNGGNGGLGVGLFATPTWIRQFPFFQCPLLNFTFSAILRVIAENVSGGGFAEPTFSKLGGYSAKV